jgi:hypothetical protein
MKKLKLHCRQISRTLLCPIALMSLTACNSVRVVSQDRVVIPLPAGRPFTPSIDGVFMSTTLYQRTQRAVADRILELTPDSAK